MKKQRISTILMSAYLSAMLASSMAPMYSGITLAGTVNPSAAQAAFSNAVGSLDATWLAATAGASPAPAAPEPVFAVASVRAPSSDPIMSDEMLARLLKLIADQQKQATIPAGVCAMFKMCDGTAKLPMRMIQTENPKGNYMAKPWDGNTDDIVVARKMPDGSVHFYLTDKTRKLRAAASSMNGKAEVVLLETAKPDYEAALALLAKEAGDLPPVTVASVGAGS